MNTQETFSRIFAILFRQRRSRVLESMLRGFLVALFLQISVISILSLYATRDPLSGTALKFIPWTWLVYVPVLFLGIWSFKRKANQPEVIAERLDRDNASGLDMFRTTLSVKNHDETTRNILSDLYAQKMNQLVLPKTDVLNKINVTLLSAGFIVFIITMFLSGNNAGFARNFFTPGQRLNEIPSLVYHVGSEDRIMGHGDTLSLRVRVENAIEGQEFFAYVNEKGAEQRFPLELFNNSLLDFEYGPVKQDFELQFGSANGFSSEIDVQVVERPRLKTIRARIVPPEYMKTEPEELPSGVTSFSVFPGSRIEWRIQANRKLSWVLWKETHNPPGGELVSGIDTLPQGEEFIIRRRITGPYTYDMRFADANGIRGKFPVESKVEIRPDLPPEVSIVAPEGTVMLGKVHKLPLTLLVKDDFGLTGLQLEYTVTSDGYEVSKGKKNLSPWLRKLQSGFIRETWDLDKLNLRPHQLVEYRIRAFDNDTVLGPKSGVSETRHIKMPSVHELLAANREKEQNASAFLRSARQRQKQVQRKMQQLESGENQQLPQSVSEFEVARILRRDPLSHNQRLTGQMERMKSRLKNSGNQASRQLLQSVEKMQEKLQRDRERIPTADEVSGKMQEKLESLKRLQNDQSELSKSLDKLKNDVKQSPNVAPQDKQLMDYLEKELAGNMENQRDLEELLQYRAKEEQNEKQLLKEGMKEQNQVIEDVEAARKEIQEMMQQHQESGLMSPEVIEKLEKVQEMLSEMVPDSLKEMMRKKMEGQDISLSDLSEGMKQLLDRQKELEDDLDYALAMLEQLKDQMTMQGWEKGLQELSKRQKELSDQMKNGQSGEKMAARQSSIRQETENLMKEIQEKAEQRAGLQKLANESRQLDPGKDMREAEKKTMGQSSQSQSQAAKSAQQAASKLEQMHSRVKQSMQGPGQAGQQVDMQALRRMIQESMELMQLQQSIRLGRQSREDRGWVGDEKKLYSSVHGVSRWLQEKLVSLAVNFPMMSRNLLTSTRALEELSREASLNFTPSIAEKAMHENQKVVRELLKLYDMASNISSQGGGQGQGQQAQGEGQGKGQGKGKGKSMGDLSSQMQGMSGKQMAINQSTMQLLKEMMNSRTQPSGQGQAQGESGQGQSQTQGSPQALGNQQGKLGEQLESMAESADDAGGAAKKLRQLAAEARQLENALRSGRVDQGIQEKQDQFRMRLLEAARSLRERGLSEERKGEIAEGISPESPRFGEEKAEEYLKAIRRSRTQMREMELPTRVSEELEEFYKALLAQ